MNVTLSVGTWAIPLIITILAVVWLLWPREDERDTGGWFAGIGLLFGLLLRTPVALTVALGSWLVWALLR